MRNKWGKLRKRLTVNAEYMLVNITHCSLLLSVLGREDTAGREGNLISPKLTPLMLFHGSSVAQMTKNLPAMWETQIRALGQEDYLEKGKATPSKYSCVENPMDREAWWLQSQTQLSH